MVLQCQILTSKELFVEICSIKNNMDWIKCLICDNKIKPSSAFNHHTYKHKGILPNSDECSFCDNKVKHNFTVNDHSYKQGF